MFEQALLASPLNLLSTDLDPLIITSPTTRCGTTLLQRLVCSSPHALIYGERCAQDLQLFINIYTAKVQEYGYSSQNAEQKLQSVLQGDVNDWIFDLTPDIHGYLSALQKSAFAGLRYCRDYALQAGRPVWGFKYPGWSPVTIRLMRSYMPGARFIFILRNVMDCVKSAKAQRLVITEQDVRQFCQQWMNGTTYAHSIIGSDPAVLVLNYEDLLDKKEDTLTKIALFSGLQDINPSTLDQKINIWIGRQFDAQLKDGYVPPVELVDAELAIVHENTSPLKQL